MFRCFVGAGPMSVADVGDRVNEWVASNAAWESDSVSHSLSERNTTMDGGGEAYHAINVRFLPDDSKDNLQQKFTDKLVNKVGWYRVGYHACEHDEDNGGPCSWDDVVEWTAKDVTIPSGVPDIM